MKLVRSLGPWGWLWYCPCPRTQLKPKHSETWSSAAKKPGTVNHGHLCQNALWKQVPPHKISQVKSTHIMPTRYKSNKHPHLQWFPEHQLFRRTGPNFGPAHSSANSPWHHSGLASHRSLLHWGDGSESSVPSWRWCWAGCHERAWCSWHFLKWISSGNLLVKLNGAYPEVRSYEHGRYPNEPESRSCQTQDQRQPTSHLVASMAWTLFTATICSIEKNRFRTRCQMGFASVMKRARTAGLLTKFLFWAPGKSAHSRPAGDPALVLIKWLKNKLVLFQSISFTTNKLSISFWVGIYPEYSIIWDHLVSLSKSPIEWVVITDNPTYPKICWFDEEIVRSFSLSWDFF